MTAEMNNSANLTERVPVWLNGSYGTSLDRIPGWKYFMVVGLSVESVCGTLGNLLVIIAILHMPTLKSTANYFIVNLSLADLMVTAIAQPSNVVGALLGSEPYVRHPMLCSAIATLCATGCISSTWNICMIAVNRYVVICHFQTYDKVYTKRNTILMCIGVWVIIYLIQLPNHLGWGDNRYSQLLYLCTFATHEYLYTVFYFGLGVYVPVIISFLAYLKIFLRVRNSKFVRSRAVDPHAKLHSRQQVKSMMENIKIARVLFKVFVIFLVMWTPAVIVFVTGLGPRMHPGWYVTSSLLAHGNSTLNVIFYAAALPQFRESIQAMKTSVLNSTSLHSGSKKSTDKPSLPSIDSKRSNETPAINEHASVDKEKTDP